MSSRPRVGDILVAVKDSEDLGVDRGMRLHVVWVKGNKMDVDVPTLDARIAGVRVGHPDLAPIGAVIKGKTKAQIAQEIEAVLGKHKCAHCDD